MIKAEADFVDRWRTIADLIPGFNDVFAVLAAAAVAAEHRREKAEGFADAVIPHFCHGFDKKRLPVAIAEVNRQVDIAAFQFALDRRNQLAVLFVDRANAIEVVVVFCDLQHAFSRDRFSAEHIFEERDHIFVAFGPSERYQQQRIVSDVRHGQRTSLDSISAGAMLGSNLRKEYRTMR